MKLASPPVASSASPRSIAPAASRPARPAGLGCLSDRGGGGGGLLATVDSAATGTAAPHDLPDSDGPALWRQLHRCPRRRRRPSRTDDAPPGKPTSISAEGLGDGSTMLVRVGEAAYSGGVPVRFVELEWRTARAASVWEPVPSVGNHSVSPSTFFPLTFHVARPRLDLEYHFRARAVNALGASEWSEDVRVLSTNALRPPMPVNFTTIAGTATSSSATFSWNMPPGLNGSLHGITYYSLELVPTSAHATAIEAVVTSSNLIGADLECETVCSVIVSGLVPAATYIATVSAVNGGGGGLSLGSLPTPGINMTTAASIPAAVATLSVATAYANVGPVLPVTSLPFSSVWYFASTVSSRLRCNREVGVSTRVSSMFHLRVLSLSYLDMDILKTSDVFSFTASAVLKEPLLSAAGICNEAIGPGRAVMLMGRAPMAARAMDTRQYRIVPVERETNHEWNERARCPHHQPSDAAVDVTR